MWSTICSISAMTLDSDTFEFQMNLGRLSLQNWQKKIPVNAIVDEIRDKLTVVLYDLIFNYLYRVIDSVMKKN